MKRRVMLKAEEADDKLEVSAPPDGPDGRHFTTITPLSVVVCAAVVLSCRHTRHGQGTPPLALAGRCLDKGAPACCHVRWVRDT